VAACYDGTSGCTYNAGTKTYTCAGECRAGTKTCVANSTGTEWGPCQNQTLATAETCNNKDDDCNGTKDDGLGSTSCGRGECARTVQNCLNGAPQTCVEGTPVAEVCNGKDDDCNGINDDLAQPITTCGVGACQRQVTACIGGNPQTCNAGNPGTETCNGIDDDCNGTVDDGLGSTTCGIGECRRTVQNCVNGAPQLCVKGTPTAEVCDGLDNNCNGTVDDVVPATLSCGTGACARTVPACANNANNTCTAGTPTTESCDGTDEDCNGVVDDNIPPGSCNTGLLGVCSAGHLVCYPVGFQHCDPDVAARAEICGNGLDDDCDGRVDNGCGCNASIDNDKDGYNQCQDCDDADGAIHPGVAEKCNGKDDNCDGTIDEGFDKDGDGYTTCGTVPGGGLDPRRIDCNDNDNKTNPGVTCDCAPGCTVSPPVGLTVGDTKDNNCNGTVDETCNCSNADADRDGQSPCQGDCNDADPTVYRGAPELCDKKDNDCNSATVENCDVGQTCTPGASGPDVCKDRLLCATDIGSGRSTCGSLCNYSLAGSGVGDGCRAGESCAASLVIADNDHLCTASGTAGAAAAGGSCKKDGDCKSNNCVNPPGYCTDLCGNDANYCSTNTACVVLFHDNATQPQYSYFSGHCILSAYMGTKRTGDSCNTGKSPPDCRYGDESCRGGTATVAGRCAAPCCKNADCPASYFCDGNGITERLPAYILGETCTNNAQCGTGATCDTTSGKCKRYVATGVPACVPRTTTGTRVAGASCSSNADCLSQFCERTNLGGVCVDMCCNDANCANGTRCELVMVQKPTGELQSMRVCVHSPVPVPASSGMPELVWQ
jgi:hypothetical protein